MPLGGLAVSYERGTPVGGVAAVEPGAFIVRGDVSLARVLPHPFAPLRQRGATPSNPGYEPSV